MKCKAAQKGIALIQVLLLTAILSVLVLYITHTARQKVIIATYADEKVQAYVQLENLKNRILFHLLTSDMQSAMEYKPMGSSQIINHWNLYGEPFKITDKVTVRLQDQSGLLPIHFIDKQKMVKILVAANIELSRAQNIVENVSDWQDVDNLSAAYGSETDSLGLLVRNTYVPDVSDILHINNLSDIEYGVIKSVYTLYYPGYFNPVLAPSQLLKSMVSDFSFRQIETMRNDGTEQAQQFAKITNIDEAEDVFFTPSGLIELTLSYISKDITLKKKWVVSVKPYAVVESPINYLESRG